MTTTITYFNQSSAMTSAPPLTPKLPFSHLKGLSFKLTEWCHSHSNGPPLLVSITMRIYVALAFSKNLYMDKSNFGNERSLNLFMILSKT